MFSFNEKYTMFGTTPVENQFLLEYMPASSGEQLKVYLYGLLACHNPQDGMGMEQMKHDLDMSEEEILKAYRHWERLGLVERIGDHPPQFRYVHVNQMVFMGEARDRDFAYEQFTESVYALFGNDYRLHGQTLVRYYEWVEELGLPQEVVLMLIKHMISTRGKNFSFTAADRLAGELSRMNVKTIDDAEAALSLNTGILQGARQVLRRFSIHREPTEDEMELYRKWLVEWGYTSDSILEACKETTAASSPSFKYLDGILHTQKRLSGDVSSAQKVRRDKQERQDKEALLREVSRILGAHSININDGTIAVLETMQAMYPDDVILLAARECAPKRDAKLEDVMSLLESWNKRGLGNRTEIEEYIRRFRTETALLGRLSEVWGTKKRNGESQRIMVRRWLETYQMSEEMILHCAVYAREAGSPLGYLDKILADFHERGIRDIQSADAARAAYAQGTSQAPQGRAGGVKQVQEQQYEQRENRENRSDTIPEWFREHREELTGSAKGNTAGTAE